MMSFRCILPFLLLISINACSTAPLNPPTPLNPIQTKLNVQPTWKFSIGNTKDTLLAPLLIDDTLFVAAKDGTLVALAAQNGKLRWRADLEQDLSAGPHSDGTIIAVVTTKGDVIALDHSGQVLWKKNQGAAILGTPLVGHGLVIVRSVNDEVIALEAQSGETRWTYRQKNTIALSLYTYTQMTFIADKAVAVGFSKGQLVVLNLQRGSVQWSSILSLPKGVSEVERMNDVVGTPSIYGQQICAANFQGYLACFALSDGELLWRTLFSAVSGIMQDQFLLVGNSSQSSVMAFHPQNGTPVWKNDLLRFRNLTSPLLLLHTVVVGDLEGYLHFLERTSGTLVARSETDGTPIMAPLVAFDQLVIVQTQKNIAAYTID